MTDCNLLVFCFLKLTQVFMQGIFGFQVQKLTDVKRKLLQ